METQKDIEKFLLRCGNEDPLMDDFLFHKLYNRLGESQEDNIIRDILEYSFDFSNKKNNCVAMNVGEFSVCGEPCEDVYCYKHILQIKILGWLPRPCGVCGMATINTYCNTCILETRERDQNILLAKEFEDGYVKTSSGNASGN